MNPTKPAQAIPRKLVQNILDKKVSFVAGSPAIWAPLAKYCLKHNIQLPSVKYLVMFGAPVRNELHEDFKKILTNGTAYPPYGATETLPVTCISGKEVLEKTAHLSMEGKGTCVGPAVPGIEIKIIAVRDATIERMEDAQILGTDQVGEILVKGPVVTRYYYMAEEETKRTKIKEGNEFWHRMGDMGQIDSRGRLWFCGRKMHRIESDRGVYYSVPVEAIFNQHPAVRRTALVNNNQKPEIAIEMNSSTGKISKIKLEQELMELGAKFPHTKTIRRFHYKKSFPVDVRHNIKIDRAKLSEEFSSREY